ncbi:MAG: hypothetical protein IPJ40_24330 [Saprospirales bacterium]|nr:hypothetical protein [Saprospirales bacterium]
MEDCYYLLRKCWDAWFSRWERGGDKVAEFFLYLEDDSVVQQWEQISPLEQIDFHLLDHRTERGSIKPLADIPKIIFDHHGNCLEKIEFFQVDPKTGDQDFESFAGENAYCYFDKNSKDYSKIYFPPASKNSKELLLYEIIEAGLFKVLILDERIAEISTTETELSKKYRSIHPYINTDKPHSWHVGMAGNLLAGTHISINGDPIPLHESVSGKPYNLHLVIEEGEAYLRSSASSLLDVDMVILHRTLQ